MQANNKVVIYEDSNFQGASKELDVGNYNSEDLGIRNNKLSSLKVPPGMRVTLYDRPEFKGKNKIFTSDADLEGDEFNNKTSSIKVERVMIPGQIIAKTGEVQLNAGRRTIQVEVVNRGDRPIQVGSHFHFYEVNEALEFDREKTKGMHLNIPAGTAVRFDPTGEKKPVELVEFAGQREIYGFNGKVNGPLG